MLLHFELAADAVTDRPVTILGPDLREAADGKNLGLAKMVAGLTGLGADDIYRRAERSRRRRGRIWAALAGAFFLLAVAAAGSAVYAWQQLKTNEAFLGAALKTATQIVNTAVEQARKYNVPRAATLELLAKAESLFDDMARFGRPTPELQRRKAISRDRRAGICDDLFIDLLRRFTKENRFVGSAKSAIYAPVVFAKEEEAKRGGVRSKALEAAMARLFKAGKVCNESHGRPSRERYHLALK